MLDIIRGRNLKPISSLENREELLPDIVTLEDMVEEVEENAPLPQPTGQQNLFNPQKVGNRISGDLLELVNESKDPIVRSAAEIVQRNDRLVFDENGKNVLVRITGDINRLLPTLESDFEFETQASKPELNFVEGFVPIELVPRLNSLEAKGLGGVLPVISPITNIGSVTSQADFVHETDRVRASLPAGFDGTGVRVGVMSDSYNALGGAGADILSGDLPAAADISILQDFNFGSDEGRAMMQLVRDLAPGASQAFSSVFFGEADFAQQIRNLADPGLGNAQVLVDDIIYFTEPFFQDGIVAQAVDEVVANRGVTYFSSAGNSRNQAYESTNFNGVVDAGLDAIVTFPGTYHDFDPGAGVDTRQQITLTPNQRARFALQWDDPFYTTNGVDTDVDIYLLDSSNNIVASSVDANLINQTPFEFIDFTNNTGSVQNYDVVIANFSGPDPGRIKYINFGSTISAEYPLNAPTINGHAAAENAQAVAAVPYFDQDNPEPFTSLGPTTILFEADGTPKATPEVRQTPDIAAIDGTDTTFFGTDVDGNGLPNFFGTSAAAPHAAAVSALVQQANPSFTPQQVYDRLASTAEDIGAPGADDLTGAGLINAYDAIFGPVAPAPLNFFDDFEDGDLSIAYETNSTGAGRIQVTGDNGPIDTRHVLLDSSRNLTDSLNEMILHVDATDAVEVELTFDQREFDDEDQVLPATFTGSVNADGVALSVDGTNWFRLVSLTGSNSINSYQNHSFDLSQVAADNGLTLGSDVQIKFQQFDNFGAPTDGFAFDNISVTGHYPINGTPNRDVITGSDRDDIITGMGSSDLLTGGLGADRFVYERIQDRIDLITDFELGQDRLDFSQLLDSLGLTSEHVAFGDVPLGTRVSIDVNGGTPGPFSPFLTVQGAGVTAATLDDPNHFIF